MLQNTKKIYGGTFMSSKAMSLKGNIKNYAKSNNIAVQVVLQNYMFRLFSLEDVVECRR